MSIGGVSATGGILDNDKPSITTVEVGAAGVSDDNVLEGKALVYNVTLSAPTTIASTYSFVLGSGSATSGADFNATPVFSDSVTYDSASKTITVPAGVSAFTVTYSTIDDTVVDSASPETLPLSIGGVSATGGILDNDKPSITTVEVGAAGVSDDNVLEGKALVYNVTLSAPTTIASTYSFVLGSGGALGHSVQTSMPRLFSATR
ncbi:MAG: hypothetical protein IPH54_10660 [Rhodoferax sp.]|nr:hypothetical protein [Rhodoferax sp.]